MDFIEQQGVSGAAPNPEREFYEVIVEDEDDFMGFKMDRHEGYEGESIEYQVFARREMDDSDVESFLSSVGRDPEVYADTPVTVMESPGDSDLIEETFGIFAAYEPSSVRDYAMFDIHRGLVENKGMVGLISPPGKDDHQISLTLNEFDADLAEHHFGEFIDPEFVEQAVRGAEYRMSGYEFEFF